MSWPAIAAVAASRRLPPMLKLLLLALADYTDATTGLATVSNRKLRAWTGQSEQSVRRGLKELEQRQLVRIERQPTVYECAAYAIPPAIVVGGATVAGGAKSPDLLLPGRHPNRSITDPVQKQKSRAAAERRLEVPTRDQVTKLCHLLIDDPHTQIDDEGDLDELLKRACNRAGFLYDGTVVRDGINRALAQRNQNLNRPFNLERARRRI